MRAHWLPSLSKSKAVLLALLWGGYGASATTTQVEEKPRAPQGTVYYVSTGGNDSNPGTLSQPWLTIQKAAGTMVAGDTVFIRGGTYPEIVQPANSGSPGNYVVYAVYPGETATIDGASVVVPEWGGLFEVAGRAYIRISGLRVMNAGPNPHNPGILVDGSNHVIIENNYVYNTMDSGIGVWSSSNVIVDNNEIGLACAGGYNECISIGGTDVFEVKNNRVHDSTKEGIAAKDGASNGKVFRNLVYGTEAVGFYVDAQNKYTHDIEVFENVSRDGVEDGFAIASEVGGLLENVSVYNNVAYDNGWVGFHVTDCCIDNHPMSNIQIVNNTSYNNGRDPWGGGIALDNPQAQGVVIRNNVCSQNLSFQIAVGTVPPGNYTVEYNLIDGYRGGEAEVYGNSYVEGDPLFESSAARNFHLRQGSPAIGEGTSVGAPTADIEGQFRGALPDIGAYEHRSSTGLAGSVEFNTDAQDEIGVFRNGMWFVTYSPDFSGVDGVTAFGSPVPGRDVSETGEFGCVPAGGSMPDGKADLVLLRKMYSTWMVTLSPDWGSVPDLTRTFGTTSHKRIPARFLDTNGDRCSDMGVFRNGCFDVLESPNYPSVGTHVCFGLGTDEPLAANLDGDGRSDLILWRASTAHYTYRLSTDSSLHGADLGAGDYPLLGDLNGDGEADLGSYKAATSTFRFSTSPSFSTVDLTRSHGVSGDIPIIADMNGDGVGDIGIFRNATARWWVLCSPSWSTTCVSQSFGTAGDIPIFGKPPGMP